MSVEKLERVLWRIRKNHKDKLRIHKNELRKAIMLEIGTSAACYQQNRAALIKLEWIKTYKKNYIELTNNDLNGDY